MKSTTAMKLFSLMLTGRKTCLTSMQEPNEPYFSYKIKNVLTNY